MPQPSRKSEQSPVESVQLVPASNEVPAAPVGRRPRENEGRELRLKATEYIIEIEELEGQLERVTQIAAKAQAPLVELKKALELVQKSGEAIPPAYADRIREIYRQASELGQEAQLPLHQVELLLRFTPELKKSLRQEMWRRAREAFRLLFST